MKKKITGFELLNTMLDTDSITTKRDGTVVLNTLADFEHLRITKEKIYTRKGYDREKKQPLEIGEWQTDMDGNLWRTAPNNAQYYIDADRLREDDWMLHLFEKGWINWNEFIPIYFQACRNAGIQSVTMKMYY